MENETTTTTLKTGCTSQDYDYEARKVALDARENITDAAYSVRVCAQALDSLFDNKMDRLIFDTIRGCEIVLDQLQTKLDNTEDLLSAI